MTDKPKTLIAYTDGGSRNKSKDGAIAVVLTDENGKVVYQLARYLPGVTSNEAEYHAILQAVNIAERFCRDVIIRSDSELASKQLDGIYRTTCPRLRALRRHIIKRLLESFDTYRFEHIPREENKQADALVNAVFDVMSMLDGSLELHIVR